MQAGTTAWRTHRRRHREIEGAQQTDRPTAVRRAIYAFRKAGTVVVLGVFAGLVDKFPLGAVMTEGLTLRSAQQHGQRYIPMLLERMERGELVTEHLATHTRPPTRCR